jgi:RNA-directed DNA polymerase
MRQETGGHNNQVQGERLDGCDSEGQARQVLAELGERLGSLGLELHSGKTKVVYCKDRKRSGTFSQTSFDFLGYTFRARSTLGPRGPFWGFNPAMATKARKTVSAKIRGCHTTSQSL